MTMRECYAKKLGRHVALAFNDYGLPFPNMVASLPSVLSGSFWKVRSADSDHGYRQRPAGFSILVYARARVGPDNGREPWVGASTQL